MRSRIFVFASLFGLSLAPVQAGEPTLMQTATLLASQSGRVAHGDCSLRNVSLSSSQNLFGQASSCGHKKSDEESVVLRSGEAALWGAAAFGKTAAFGSGTPFGKTTFASGTPFGRSNGFARSPFGSTRFGRLR